MFSEPDTEPTKTREHLVNLINLNREYQDVLKMCVKQTEAALLRNTELQVIIGTFCSSYATYERSNVKLNVNIFVEKQV